MRSIYFLHIFLIYFCFGFVILEARELSIKQIEERKQADLERLKEREKRGKKKVFKRNNFVNQSHIFKYGKKNSSGALKS